MHLFSPLPGYEQELTEKQYAELCLTLAETFGTRRKPSGSEIFSQLFRTKTETQMMESTLAVPGGRSAENTHDWVPKVVQALFGANPSKRLTAALCHTLRDAVQRRVVDVSSVIPTEEDMRTVTDGIDWDKYRASAYKREIQGSISSFYRVNPVVWLCDGEQTDTQVYSILANCLIKLKVECTEQKLLDSLMSPGEESLGGKIRLALREAADERLDF